MAGLTVEVQETIEAHLNVTSTCGCESVVVEGVEAAANAVVELLRQKGCET